MSVKIQINSLEALERLIGGDSELELELRGTIVQEFAKKHLKGVADEASINDASIVIRKYVENNYLKISNYYTKEYTANVKFKEQIEKEVQSIFSREVNKSIRDYVDSDETIAMIKKRIDDKVIAAAVKIEGELSDTILTKRIDDLVNKKLREKLGI